MQVWLGIAITVVLAPVLCFLFITYYQYQGSSCPNFKLALGLYSTGCVIVAYF